MPATIQKATRSPQELNALLALWETSVRATHTFLSAQDIAAIKPEVLPALQGIQHLYCYAENGKPQGFIGVQNQKIEMLFIDASARGKGVGRQLIAFALQQLNALYVDVNEQNTQGVGFYRHMGFRQVSRSETDEQGRPFPLLHMRYMPEAGTSIIGTQVANATKPTGTDATAIHSTNSAFWDAGGTDLLAPICLPFYGSFISEDTHRLFGDLHGKTVLEIGCGSGGSLQYLAQRGAAGLWGIDLSPGQIQKARQALAAQGVSATLRCAAMEEGCGLPTGYFDYVFSVYALGWAADLDAAMARIAAYLKPGGTFIFSWSHPIHKCVAAQNGALTFQKCYFDETWYSATLGGDTLTLCDRTMSTYINALARAGFSIQQMIEQPDDTLLSQQDSEFAQKAKMLPVTFVIKAKKS